MKTKKILCFFMALMILLLLSCGKSNEDDSSGNPDNIAGESNDDTAEPTENPLYLDDLPEIDYKGEIFRMFTWEFEAANTDLVIEEQTGDIVNDAIYLSNRAVQDRFNIEFEQISVSDWWNAQNYVKNSVRAEDNAYDIAMLVDRQAITMAMEGRYFYTMAELPHVNLDKLYWDQALKKEMSIDNILYFTYSASMLSAYDNVCFLVYNKQIVMELGLENIYELVGNGKWTIDKMYEMAAAGVKDLDGDGKMTKADRWGVLISPDYYYPGFWCAERIPLIGKDKDDIPFFNVPGNEKLFRIFDKLHGYSTGEIEFNDGLLGPMFAEGLGLFANATLFTVQRLRNMEVDYGIVPYPSLDEKKPGEAYSARMCVAYPLIVPVTASAERASVILEALACEYQKRVISGYYEVAVQTKSTRDDESIEILDMLMSNRFVDHGDTFWMDDARSQYLPCFANKANTFQSVTDKIESRVARTLEKAVEAFQNAAEQ